MTQVEPLWQTPDSASIPHPRHTLTDPHGYKQHLRPQQNMPRDKKIQTHNAARLRIYGSAQTGRLGPPSAPGVRVPRCMVFQTRWGNTLRIPQTEHLVMTPRPPITHKHTHRHKHTQSHSHHIIAYTHATCGCSGERHPCDTKIQTLDNKHMRADASGRAIVRPKQAVAHARRQPCHSDASLRTREPHCQNMPGSFPDKRLKGLAAQTRQPEAKCDRIQTHPMQPHLRSLHLRPPTKGVAEEATTASEAARGGWPRCNPHEPPA